MKRILVQIYEIQTPREAEAMVGLGVDHVGSVVTAPERWNDPEIAETVRASAAGGAKTSLIPLFSDPDTVYRCLDFQRPHMVHFCEAPAGDGRMDAYKPLIDLQEGVKKRFPQIRVIRSIPIAPPGFSDRVPTLEIARLFEPASDFFLTDTLLLGGAAGSGNTQPVKGFVGITGKTCDWEMARRLTAESRIPVILAGGISPENVADGIRSVRPAGVDSCTGTNAPAPDGGTLRFRKDPERVARLVERVREAEKTIPAAG